MREAASEKADAEKILLVKAAEAEAESKYLSGLGVAKQRKAIVDGLRDTISGFSEQVVYVYMYVYVCSLQTSEILWSGFVYWRCMYTLLLFYYLT